MQRFKWWAISIAVLVVGMAMGVMAQPTVAQMKMKFFDTYIDVIYDVDPGIQADVTSLQLDGANTRNTLAGDNRVCDTVDGCPTVSVATANGELFVEGDLECDGNLNVAGTATLTGATTQTGDLALNGGASALDFTGSGASSIVVADNDATALLIGSTGLLNLVTIDTADATETVVVTGTTTADALHVDVGTAQFDESVDVDGDLTCRGAVGALTFTDTASSITLPDNDTSALDIGSTGATNLLRFDTGDATETVIVTGTTTALALHVDVGTTQLDEAVSIGGVLSGSGTTSWFSVQSAANQACDTTCTAPCVLGFDDGAADAETIVACGDATADKCLCAGAS